MMLRLQLEMQNPGGSIKDRIALSMISQGPLVPPALPSVELRI